MDANSLVVFTTVILCLNYGHSTAKQQSEQTVGVVINKLEQLLRDVSSLRQSVDQLDSDIQTSLPTDDCSLGVDKNCHAMYILSQMWLKNHLSNPYRSPGKRSVRDTSSVLGHTRTARSVEDLYRKRYMLRSLRAILSNTEKMIKAERKRSCNLNLGFHCQTDEYSSIADLYDFLSSDMSPGKRKRTVDDSLNTS
ncbi:uncharacterized protein LOC124286894 isoform X1 [Haliotis rubra]|uniref:uncharacterized protein LOC124286894 isoform X1 n=1 Tax=Haliotis rubra TaxID=36100 RepID=UPI001EE5A3DF|nr:uncharacterized protein LOC124286894 isoform X1 [Haliotis rubra]